MTEHEKRALRALVKHVNEVNRACLRYLILCILAIIFHIILLFV